MDKEQVAALIAAAKRPEKTVPLCVRGDLQADWEDLDRQLIARRSQQTAVTLGGDPKIAALAEQVKSLEAEMADAVINIRLRALPRRQFLELTQAHPPRSDNEADKRLGVNGETYFDALIAACVVEPELDPEQLAVLLDTITSRQYENLSDAAYDLNRGDVSVPFSFTASHTIPGSGGTSKQQHGSGSPTSGSAGGSRRKSSSTSTKAAG